MRARARPMVRGRSTRSSRLMCQSPPWKVPTTGMPNAAPTAMATSKRGYSYSWTRIAVQRSSRSTRASARGGVATYGTTSRPTSRRARRTPVAAPGNAS